MVYRPEWYEEDILKYLLPIKGVKISQYINLNLNIKIGDTSLTLVGTI